MRLCGFVFGGWAEGGGEQKPGERQRGEHGSHDVTSVSGWSASTARDASADDAFGMGMGVWMGTACVRVCSGGGGRGWMMIFNGIQP